MTFLTNFNFSKFSAKPIKTGKDFKCKNESEKQKNNLQKCKLTYSLTEDKLFGSLI